jgi:hypothetical protein
LDLKVLILAFHFSPLNIISAHRPVGFAKYLKKYGVTPTIITNQWIGKTYPDISVYNEKDDDGEYYYLKVKPTVIGMLIDVVRRIPIVRKGVILMQWALGFLDITSLTFNSYLATRKFLKSHLEKHNYDVVISIYSPVHAIRLAHFISEKFNIPTISDFRDLPENKVMSEKFSANFSDRIRLFFYSYYMTKWMSHNLFLTSTSQLWADYLSSITGVKGYELRNGFDAELFNSIDATLDQNEFVITSMGAIHAQQDLSIFYKGLHLFIKGLNKSDLKIKVNFIGISTYYRPELINELNDNIPIDLIHVSGRIPHVEAIKVMKSSQLLIFPTPLEIKGFYTGKIFDYLSSKRPIISFPGGNDLIDDIYEKTGSGYNFKSGKDLCAYLQKAYAEWSELGHVNFNPNQYEIAQYSREKQVEKLARLIHEYLGK